MDAVIQQIKQIALRYNVEKLVLFGSRARGDHCAVSDYDIAVYGKDLSLLDKAGLWADVEEVDTLKKIDLVFIDDNINDELLGNLERDGVTIYG